MHMQGLMKEKRSSLKIKRAHKRYATAGTLTLGYDVVTFHTTSCLSIVLPKCRQHQIVNKCFKITIVQLNRLERIIPSLANFIKSEVYGIRKKTEKKRS
jgi:hypothetical protein